MEHLGTSGHVRLGWSTREAELQTPVRVTRSSFTLWSTVAANKLMCRVYMAIGHAQNQQCYLCSTCTTLSCASAI